LLLLMNPILRERGLLRKVTAVTPVTHERIDVGGRKRISAFRTLAKGLLLQDLGPVGLAVRQYRLLIMCIELHIDRRCLRVPT
jgi:hypothetical protein